MTTTSELLALAARVEAEIPDYPFWSCDSPEWAFGATRDRYLKISKYEAQKLYEVMPSKQSADELMITGAIVNSPWPGHMLEALDPKDVRCTMASLIRSFAVSHEIKQATVAVALYRWFPLPTATQEQPA